MSTPATADRTSYVFFSHDGFGVGHLRRNSRIAAAILDIDPGADITLVSGIPTRPSWLEGRAINVVHVPPVLKHRDGTYRTFGLTFYEALARRGEVFTEVVTSRRPRVVIVDRHPYGTAGELRHGLELAREDGASLVLGLRDVLDSPGVAAQEVQGPAWAGADDLYDEMLVYGGRRFCNHQAEYGVPVTPTYCGWVAERASEPLGRDPRLLVVAAGGGGDGADVFRLGMATLAARPSWHAILAAGPYADRSAIRPAMAVRRRVQVLRDVPGCAPLLARAGASLQMAGYNSTFEALAAGVRPILVPRTQPRREQAIRAERLVHLGLADVVGPTDTARVAALLERNRLLEPAAVAAAGIDLDGATVAARRIVALATVGSVL